MMAMEFYCPYCKRWITDVVHREDHHNDPDEVDERRTEKRRRVTEDDK